MIRRSTGVICFYLFSFQFSARPALQSTMGDFSKLGSSTIDPPIPDAWYLDETSTNAGISRLCWGWRSDLEVAVRESDFKSAKRLIKSYSKKDVLTFAQCCDLLFKACARGNLKIAKLFIDLGSDVDALHYSQYAPNNKCSKRMKAIRECRGYNGCTPLYGASQGEPGVALEGRAQVAEYLLQCGANPMLPNDSGITPLFIASVNNALPIVQAMIATGKCDVNRPIPDGETPLSVVRATRRNKAGGPDGYTHYQPMLELLEPLASDNGMKEEGEAGLIEKAMKKKKVGNESFQQKDFTTAIQRYTRAIEILHGDGGEGLAKNATREMKDLCVILYSNQAEAFLQLGACFRAERSCENALAIDPSHKKSILRQERAKQAVEKYRATQSRFSMKFQEYVNLVGENEFARAAELAAELKEIAKDLDVRHRTEAILAESEMCFHQATSDETENLCSDIYLEKAAKLADDALSLCHDYERRTFEIDYSETSQRRLSSGRLHVKAAASWLLLGRIYKAQVGHNDRTGVTAKFNEALAELEKAVAELDGGEFFDSEAAHTRMFTLEQLVEVYSEESQWERVNEIATTMTEAIEHLAETDASRGLFQQFALHVINAANSLADGADITRSLMCRMFYAVATSWTAYNEFEEAARVYRMLINARHRSWGLKDGKCVPPDNSEANDDSHDVKELVSLLQKMGRDVSDTCSICLEPFDGNVVDVLKCLHIFHPGCVREIFEKYPTSLRQEDDGLVSSGECPNCREKVEMLCM